MRIPLVIRTLYLSVKYPEIRTPLVIRMLYLSVKYPEIRIPLFIRTLLYLNAIQTP